MERGGEFELDQRLKGENSAIVDRVYTNQVGRPGLVVRVAVHLTIIATNDRPNETAGPSQR